MALDPVSTAIEASIATADPTSQAAETLDTAADTALDTPVVPEVTTKVDATATPTSGDKPDAVVSPSSGAAAAKAAVADAVVPAATPQDPLDKELEALGLKAPKEGERENRLPHSRVRTLVGKAIKNTEGRLQTQVTEATTRATQAEEKLQTYGGVDKLIVQDPDRYMGMLAALHPDKYGKYVKGGQAATPAGTAKPVPTPAGRPMPQPDATFSDGSKGYSDTGLADLLKWNKEEGAREAKAEMQAEFDRRLGPIENERRSAQLIQERIPIVRGRVEQAKKDWGPLFEQDYNLANEGKSEILKMMQANDGEQGRPFLPFETCVARVLLPKIQKEQTTMREGILAELKERPAAAVRTPAGPAKPAVETGPRSMEDVIKESLRAAGH